MNRKTISSRAGFLGHRSASNYTTLPRTSASAGLRASLAATMSTLQKRNNALDVNDFTNTVHAGIHITTHGSDWLRFSTLATLGGGN